MEKKLSRPRILCDVQGHSRQQTSVFHLVFFSFFFHFFSRCFSAAGVLCFCNSLCCMRREELAMQCFRLTQKSSRTWVWVWTHVSGWSVCNQKNVYTHTHIYIFTHTHIHDYTHTLGFRGNTSILSSPSSKVGLFLPHLVVTWLLSANQGFFLNQLLPPPPPQDMFLKVFS